jgi:hypothetical protein
MNSPVGTNGLLPKRLLQRVRAIDGRRTLGQGQAASGEVEANLHVVAQQL